MPNLTDQTIGEKIKSMFEPVELVAFLAAVAVVMLIMLNLALQFSAMAIT